MKLFRLFTKNYFIDTIPVWISLCYWSGEDIQVLLSKAQSERHRFLLWRHCHSSVWMAHHWYDSRDLWVRLTL
jgi:hypothetical protein